MIFIKGLFKSVVIITLFSTLSRFLGFIFRIFLSRALTPTMLGIYTITISVFMVFLTAITSGLPLTISKITARNMVDKNTKNTNKSISAGVILSFLFATLIVILILLFKNLFNFIFSNELSYILLLLTIPALFFTAIHTPIHGYLWGKENYFAVSFIEFIEQVVRIVTCFIAFLVFSGINQIYPIIISLSISCLVSTIIYIFYFIKSKGKFEKPTKFEFSEIFKSSAPITSVRIATSIIQPIISVLLPLRLVLYGFTKEQALATLGIAMGMTIPILTIPSTIIGSLAMALIPQLTTLHKENQNTKLKNKINFAIQFSLICSCLVIPIFYSLAEPICMFLFNNLDAGIYLKASCFLLIPMNLSHITTSILNSLNKEVKTFKYSIIGCVFLLLCIWFLPKYVGVYSLIYGLGLNMIIVSILNIYKINKTINQNKTHVKSILLLLLINIPLILLTSWVYNLSSFIFPSFIAIIIACIVEVIFYVLLCNICNIIQLSYIKNYVINLKNKKTLKS